jgi:hypothetical protein
MKSRINKQRRSRRLNLEILQELAEAELEAMRLRDQNEDAYNVLQRELGSPTPQIFIQIGKEAKK